MTNPWANFFKKVIQFYLLPFVILSIALKDDAVAQISSDNTLGNSPSVVNYDVPIQGKGIVSNLVTGGAVRDINLFHSFLELNVSEQGLFFAIPNDTKIENIITRVTGNNPTNILGRLGVLGDSNLFLINPNGIIFGPKASLDLKGSFVATTANAIQFGDQGFFDASTPNDVPLLTVNPSAFFFTRPNVQSVANNSIEPAGARNSFVQGFLTQQELFGLRVPDGKSLLLLGGNVSLDGGGLNALGGRVEIGSVSGVGIVELNGNGSDLHLNIPQNLSRGDVSLLNGATVDASGEGGGGIQVFGRDIRLTNGSRITSESLGSLNGADLNIDSTNSLELSGLLSSSVSTYTTGTGNAGNIEITANNLFIKDGGQILTVSLGDGNGGDLIVNALNLIDISGVNPVNDLNSGLFSNANSKGNGGDILINTNKDLIIRDGGAISTSSLGIFNSESLIPASGNSGNLNIFAANSVQLLGQQPSFIDLSTFGFGGSGNLDISTKNLSIKDGSSISLATYGERSGGNFNAVVTDSTFLSNSSISAASLGTGDAGNVTLDTGSLNLLDDSSISVSSPEGKAGALKITANSIALNNGSFVAENGKSGTGNEANIILNVSEIITIENESLISATAFENAMGGNITFNTPLLVVFPSIGSNGSDIIAKADRGNGGNILVNAQGIFGIKERAAILGNQSNDIDASSEFGTSGNVKLNAETDPSKDLVELPSTVVDPSALVAQTPCKRSSGSEFTRSGRGGLPPSLAQDLSHDATQVGLVKPVGMANQPSRHEGNSAALAQPSKKVRSEFYNPILPAQGWVFNNKGQVVLVANNPSTIGAQRLKAVPAGCPVP